MIKKKVSEGLQSQLKNLAEQCRQAGSAYLEISDSHYFRWSVTPDMIFFDESFFTATVIKKGKYEFIFNLSRQSINTPLGEIEMKSTEKVLPNNLGMVMEKVISGQAENDYLPRLVRSALQDDYQLLGLRQLIKTKGKRYLFCCQAKLIPNINNIQE